MMKGTSTIAVSVAEAKKSRSASSSRIMPGERAGRALLQLEPHRQHPLEHRLADIAVDLGAGMVDEIGAKQLQDEIEDDDDGEADGERDQRGGGVVRDDAVVDRHREQGGQQAEDVDEHRRERDLPIGRAGWRASAPSAIRRAGAAGS